MHIKISFALREKAMRELIGPLWVETQTVTADARGHFVELLGAISPNGLPLDLFSTNHAVEPSFDEHPGCC